MVFLLLVLAMWIHLFLNLTARQECQYWTILQHPKLQSMTNIFLLSIPMFKIPDKSHFQGIKYCCIQTQEALFSVWMRHTGL